MPTAHAVDAGDISWIFDLPQPTVTLTKPSAVAYAIDAGDISWLFTLPQPTVTHVSSISPPAAPTAPTAADIGLDFVDDRMDAARQRCRTHGLRSAHRYNRRVDKH